MMHSLILSVAARTLLPLLLIFSLFLLVRGHNEPGGGFAGGLVAAAAFGLYGLAYDVKTARDTLQVDPITLLAVGLLVALVSGLFGLVAGLPFLTGFWWGFPLPVIGNPGTPLLFDIGVYITVLGVTLTIIFNLFEE
jgi:multicomponent Na+:H+ antiporter subunit B